MAEYLPKHHRPSALAEFEARVRDTDALLAEAAGEVEPYTGKHRAEL